MAVLPADVLPENAGKEGNAGENAGKGVDASDMEAVDGIVEGLRRKSELKRETGK